MEHIPSTLFWKLVLYIDSHVTSSLDGLMEKKNNF